MNRVNFVVLGVVLSLFQSTPSLAAVKLGTPEKTTIKDVALSQSVQIDEKGTPLKRVTQGLRQKKVVLAWFSVYVAQIFTNGKADFSSVAKLKDSLESGLPVVVTMTFLRDVDNGKILEGFKDVLQKNNLDINKAPYKDFLSAVEKAGEVKDRQLFTFIFDRQGDKESFIVQTKGKEMFSLKDQPKSTVAPFFNLWLGKTTDSGLDQLQEYFLKPNDVK